VGDVDARLAEVEAVYRWYLPQFQRLAAAVCGDRDAAPDIVQDAFVRAVRELSSFRGESRLETWLWRIVVNTARNHRRDRLASAQRSSTGPAIRSNGSDTSETGRISAAVAALPERQRLVLFLHYYADLDYGAIAEALEIAPGTVGATLSAARATLRQQLSELEPAR
jgi:RNA polymerase sigma-70 factor, ECF subfamily